MTATSTSTARMNAMVSMVPVIVRRYFWNRPAARLTIMATMAVVKKNDSAPWATTMRRVGFWVMATSETWNVMPTTKEK